ncbi:MAG: ferritin-like domain-containing protein [Caldiserica bacterium]|jgi:bacterioferritin|nr:ferritin-like domain-containing protein [Caldisericota bacterium]MDH7562414.1 ferritin-like domain-containing protein [Caldisericota bacterium]
MGTKGREIVGVDVKELINLLNKALSDEWLAFYQYWVGALVSKGKMHGEVEKELSQHAQEEFQHAEILAKRIIQLGGTPVIKPEDWYKLTNCGYDAPEDPDTQKLLIQNIKGEQCAISTYQKLIEFLGNRDIVTMHLLIEILEDEVEHEEDLEVLLEDLKSFK